MRRYDEPVQVQIARVDGCPESEVPPRRFIWQGRVWSTARAGQGWRPYTGGGIYDPSDPTGGHFDHIHVSLK